MKCTCEMTSAGTYDVPPEWEQDPFCPEHPDEQIIDRARQIMRIVGEMVQEARGGTWNSGVRSNQLLAVWLGLPVNTRYDALWDHLHPDDNEVFHKIIDGRPWFTLETPEHDL